MCEVLDKITIKFEILHQLSVVEHGMSRKVTCLRLFSVFSAS